MLIPQMREKDLAIEAWVSLDSENSRIGL